MIDKYFNKTLSFTRNIFYEKISPKFKKNSLKEIIDFLYVMFEKIAIKFNIISINYLNLYEEIVQKEIKMANIVKSDSIIVIGCGTLPSTPLLISMKTKAKVVAIDKDKKAIKGAKNFLSNINLKNTIKLIHANGLNYPINDFDVIIFLYGVKNLDKIIDNLYDKITSGKRIIIRTNNEINNSFFKRFNIISHVESKYLGEVNSYLIKK